MADYHNESRRRIQRILIDRKQQLDQAFSEVYGKPTYKPMTIISRILLILILSAVFLAVAIVI